jgi:hypothetical protein
MKALAFLKLGDAGDAEARRHLVDAAIAAVRKAQLRGVVNEVHASQGQAAWDAVVELWVEEAAQLASLDLAALVPGGRCTMVAVEERVEKDVWNGRALPADAIKLIVGWTRRAELSSAEARRHWDEHVPIANRVHIGVGRYVRHWLAPTMLAGNALPYDGVAEQTFIDAKALKEGMYDSAAGEAEILADVQEFIGSYDIFTSREHPCG